MKLENLETYLVTTAVSDGNGKFHPGVRHGLQVFYWGNRKFDTEDEAEKAAKLAVADAVEAANSVIESWNLTSLT